MQYQSWYITGASSGIGEAFAKAAPPEARLLLGGQDEARLIALKNRLGDRVTLSIGDLTLAADRETALLQAEEAQIDLLILNAGIGQFGSFLHNPPKREMEMMLLNMVAPIEAIRALAPGMIERARQKKRRAGIILVSSVAAFIPIPYLATYSATKTFLKFFGEAFYQEIKGQPLDFLILCPGTTHTRFFQRAHAKESLGLRGAPPEQVAKEGLSAIGHSSIHIVGATNRWTVRVLGLLPHRWILGLVGRFMQSRAP